MVTSLVTKLRKALLLGSTTALLFAVFVIDIIRKSLDADIAWLSVVRELGVVAAFLLFYLFLESLWRRDQSPASKIGFALVLSLVVGAASLLISFMSTSGFDIKNYSLIPIGYDAIVWANIYAIVIGTLMLIVLLLIRDIILSKRRKGTRRNFFLLLLLIVASAGLALTERPLESSTSGSILLGVTVVVMIVNSFRLSWIVYLSKREKILCIVYGALLFGLFIGFDIITSGSMIIGRSLAYYSPALRSFVFSVSIFATIYFGMTFVSTLFHLPTAEAFDRKLTEVSSLHNLSRLVTQVFDFNELVESVTTMTLEVCEAKSAWLEIITVSGSQQASSRLLAQRKERREELETVSMKNISEDEIKVILHVEGDAIRKLVLDARRPVVIDEVRSDRRTKHVAGLKNKFNSMVIVPLKSQEQVIGILYATKEIAFGFDREDVEAISAFADQATLAIENSRLIGKSLERERLMREMMLAQEMQRKLLPQVLPALPEIDLDALSTPAFEVGGDYYDIKMLDEDHLALLVGDVSGKGVSAAFYMAEMKGIFQSLAQTHQSPKEFLGRAHAALAGTIDKRSFISLIYAVLDLRTGVMTIARAGHCPLLYVSSTEARYVTPTGLALGMGNSEFFRHTMREEEIVHSKGDVIVMYTDGVTEAHPKDSEEFGYDRLLTVVQEHRLMSASEVRDGIITEVDAHMDHESPEDDLTIVVLKWLKL